MPLIRGEKSSPTFGSDAKNRILMTDGASLDRSTSALTPGYFDLPAGSSAGRGAALAAGAVAAVRAVFDLRRS